MFGDNLKKLRRSAGMSQQQLADRLCVVRQTVSKWEKGISVPDCEMLVRISGILGVPEEIFLSDIRKVSGEKSENTGNETEVSLFNAESLIPDGQHRLSKTEAEQKSDFLCDPKTEYGNVSGTEAGSESESLTDENHSRVFADSTDEIARKPENGDLPPYEKPKKRSDVTAKLKSGALLIIFMITALQAAVMLIFEIAPLIHNFLVSANVSAFPDCIGGAENPTEIYVFSTGIGIPGNLFFIFSCFLSSACAFTLLRKKRKNNVQNKETQRYHRN